MIGYSIFGLALLSLAFAALNVNTNTCARDQTTCLETNVAINPAEKHGENEHYYIGGLFAVHQKGTKVSDCSSNPISLEGIMNLEAFLWAVDRFKGNHSEVGIGAVAFDSCSRGEQTVENMLSFEECKVLIENVEPRNLLAYVGPDSDMEVKASAAVLKDLKKPVISPGAFSDQFSDVDNYPFLFRSGLTTDNDATAMVALVNDFGFKHVVLAYQESPDGISGANKFEELFNKDGGCVVYKSSFSGDVDVPEASRIFQNFVDQADSKVKVMVVYADRVASRAFLKGGNEIDKLQEFPVFIGTSGWCSNLDVIENLKGLSLAFTLSRHHPTSMDASNVLAEFKTHFESLKPDNNRRNPWFKSFWAQHFGCQPDEAACKQKQLSIAVDGKVPFTILAVRSVIYGVKETVLETCNAPTDMHLCNTLLNDATKGNYLMRSISKLDIYDDKQLSNKYKKYSINMMVLGAYENAGYYDFSQNDKLTMTTNVQFRFRISDNQCPSDPCTQCGESTPPPTVASTATDKTEKTTKGTQLSEDNVAVMVRRGQEMTGAFVLLAAGEDRGFQTRFDIGHNWIIALGVLAGLGILCVLVFEIYIIYKLIGTKNTHWRTMWLGQVLLCGIFLSYLTLFAYIPIPTSTTCGITRFGVGFCYSVLFSVLLVKLMVILTSKSSDALIPGDVESPNYLKGIYQFLMFVFAVSVQLVIDIQWLITVPPEAVQVVSNNGDTVWVCNHYTWAATGNLDDSSNMLGFVRNEFENHLITLVYVMLLILINTVVALRAHGIITNHRESVFIGIASGFSIPIFLAWGLVGGLNREHLFAQEFGDAAMAFGLFLVATLIMFGMFLPKVRQLVNIGMEGIYLEDDRDTYYAGSVIMAPPSYKSKPGSIVYAQNGGLYSDPVVLTDQNALHLKASSVYSAPPTYIKKGDASISAGSKVLRVTGDLTGKSHPVEKRRPLSEVNYGRPRPRSERGTLPRSRSQQDLGAL